MFDFTLSIKVGDGVNSLYRCGITDGNGEKISEIDLPNKESVLSWVRNNLPSLWINRLDENKISVEKLREGMKRH